jgi:hypothetical protein
MASAAGAASAGSTIEVTAASRPLVAARAVIAGLRQRYLDAVHADGLASRDKAARRLRVFEESAEELAALGAPALAALLDALRAERDPHARLLLLTAVSRLAGDAAVEGTLEALRRLDDPTIEALFIDRLARSGEPGDLRVLEALLERCEDPAIRGAAIASGASRRNAAVAARLAAVASDDPDPRNRLGALRAAERAGASMPADVLARLAAEDPEPSVRVAALESAAAAHPGRLAELASSVLSAPGDIESQRAVIRLLGASEDPACAAVLESLLAGDPSGVLARDAKRALRERALRNSERAGGMGADRAADR